MHMFVMETA